MIGGINLAYESLQKDTYITQENNCEEIHIVQEEEAIDKDTEIEKLLQENKDIGEAWQIEIPEIGLLAPIAEGTTQEVMKEYVGHFENTNMWKGNIGLAAHNRRFSS